MQKLLSALVALLSFISVLSGIGGGRVGAQALPANGQDQSNPMVLRPGVTHENVEVKDRPLIIEGDVKGSVHAVNSHVTLMPGATIEGNLTMEGGSLTAPTAAGFIATTRSGASPAAAPSRTRQGDWFGAQFCLWLLGLAAGTIVLVAAPNATSRVADTVSARPGRSLIAGLVAAAIMLSALAVSGAIMNTKSFLSVLWMPVMIVIALASLFLLVFGWLAGVRRVGDILAHRFGHAGSGTFYGRMALGLSAFFVVNAVLGSIIPPLGAMSLLVEFGVALMGIGAIVQSGFGRDNPWPERRFGQGLDSNAR